MLTHELVAGFDPAAQELAQTPRRGEVPAGQVTPGGGAPGQGGPQLQSDDIGWSRQTNALSASFSARSSFSASITGDISPE